MSDAGSSVSDGGLTPDGGSNPDGGVTGPRDGGLSTPAGTWTWVPVEGTQCGSGSTAGLGVNLAPGGADDVFLFVQGGGACWNQGTCVPSLLSYGPLCDYGGACLLDTPGGQRPTAVFVTHPDPFPRDGGGAFPSELATISGSAMLDRTRSDNPFRAAHFLFVPYCTGDLHAGSADVTYQYKYGLFDPPRPYVMHFRGGDNFARYLEVLAATVPQPRRIWLTGVSGGGYGATLNFDRVQRAFPGAEVHLLADSSPFIDTSKWVAWRDTWNLQLPLGCAGCDAGFPDVMAHLAATYPTRRLSLLSYDRDRVIAWFFLAGPGANNFVNPPLGAFNASLTTLLDQYDATANTKYFVLPGEEHVLLGGYGTVRADGGVTPSVASRDGGTTLKAWVDAWATGASGWDSLR